jgi:hypothetical protein
MKIVLNSCYGGFGLSEEAMREYAKLTGMKVVRSTPHFKGDKGYFMLTSNHKLPDVITDAQWNKNTVLSSRDIDRTDPNLVKVVETLGSKRASDSLAKLTITEIPDDVNYTIEEYDGIEHVAETHRTWG